MLSFIDNRKKGISEIVSYVLLVIIAMSLSVVVYTFVSNYVPKEKAECPDDIAISIREVSCNAQDKTISINYANSGLFAIDFLYIRLAKENRTVAQNIEELAFESPLNPSQSNIYSLADVNQIDSPGTYILELEPAVWSKKKIAVCERAIAR